ncbi:MAG: hypothetical protein V4509_01920 [Patescibacteria group bacterium]
MSLAVNRPTALLDQLSNPIIQSWDDLEYRGDLNGGASLVYIGYARVGASEANAVWKIFKIAYSGTTPISITWPENTSGNASNDYGFSWATRASYTYS